MGVQACSRWLENEEQSPQRHLKHHQWIKYYHKSNFLGIAFLVSLSWGENDTRRPQNTSKHIHLILRALSRGDFIFQKYCHPENKFMSLKHRFYRLSRQALLPKGETVHR